MPLANAYQIELTGTTFSGNTAFLSSETVYTPIANFSQPGFLVVEQPIFPSNFEDTDPNRYFDLGLFVGSVFDINVLPGELLFASNTALHAYAGGNFSQQAAIDVVEQSFDPLTGTYSILIEDPTTARASQLNTFNSSSGILSAPKQILAGEINLQFSPDGQQILGNINFFGSGLIEPGTFAYSAEFSGTFIGNYSGLVESGVAVGLG
ncbi:hypothetical protein VB780_03325 [Leptolyngbya sp. CCNP1308]|uniref:hypothetical protein n=1 Tax=Leptolyngbya sp. CCNP1308 TaxID=3110255 RepID=UPI002B1F38EE|nr:hypothetical protein [Leptolyngbya sp. CCNP1308]MEA5447585.1 hypothetical protein [Leptolyngbya sp. CCNP1308]